MGASLYPPPGYALSGGSCGPLWHVWSVQRVTIPPTPKGPENGPRTSNRGYSHFGPLPAVFWGLTVWRSRLWLAPIGTASSAGGWRSGLCAVCWPMLPGLLWRSVAALAAGLCSYTPRMEKAPCGPFLAATEGKRKTAHIGRLPCVIYCA